VPAHHLATRLSAGQPWTVRLLPPEDADPGHWTPSADDIAAAQAADLVLLNGAGYEAWTATAALPATRVVDTAAAVPPLRRPGRTHSHGTEGAHSHGEIDPHTWTDPLAYSTQAAAAHTALSGLRGADREALDEALRSFDAELRQLEAELRAVAPADRALASNHPAFGHLGRRLGLEIADFDLDPAAAVDGAAAAEVATWAAAHERPVLLWEAPPSPAATGSLPPAIEHVVLDPLEHPPEGGGAFDYGTQAMRNVAVLRGL
jgi:zinc transport system substrate-binding protein